ncbi:MAG: hypothetical protein ACR2GM_07790 [Nocardioidaceae bacterium]
MSGLEVLGVAASTLALALGVVVVLVVRAHRRQTAQLQAAIDVLAADVKAAQRPLKETAPEPAEPSGRTLVVGEVVWTPDGRSVVVPTTSQVIDATLGRPLVRAAVLGHGIRRALRAKHRDRVRSMMRREFHRRRKLRLRAGRRAARLAIVRDDQGFGGLEDTGRGEAVS